MPGSEKGKCTAHTSLESKVRSTSYVNRKLPEVYGSDINYSDIFEARNIEGNILLQTAATSRIEMVYHVYLNWDKDEYSGRVILTFPSRLYADEFYNRCITTKGPEKDYLLPEIDRKAPQFWTSSNAAESRPFYFLLKNAPDLIPTVMIQRISGYDAQYGGGLPIILNDPTSLVEYKSGRAYYIRTKAQPHLYWSLEGSWIYLTERRATKFRIDRDDSKRKDTLDDRVVLVNSDDVSLTALTAKKDEEIGVGANRTLGSNQSLLQFGFGGFYNGNFGVQWPDGDDKPWVVYRAKHTGEEWELLY